VEKRQNPRGYSGKRAPGLSRGSENLGGATVAPAIAGTRDARRVDGRAYYTGTRADAIFNLRWVRSTHNGWVDLDASIIHRKGTAERETKKRRNRCRIHKRLLRHLKHWREQDMAVGITHVIHYEGDRVKEMYHAWETVRDEAAAILRNAGHPEPQHPKDAPHVMRHTAATWMLGSRKHKVSLERAAGYLGMTPDMLWKRYGHHHPEFQKNASEWR
jgi:integrase